MEDSKKRKRDEESVEQQDAEYMESKLSKDDTSYECTPKPTAGNLLSSPKEKKFKLILSETPLETPSETPSETGNKLLEDVKTSSGTLSEVKTPSGIKGRLRKTPNGSLFDSKTPNRKLSDLKTPNRRLSESKTPKRKGRLWCSDCVAEAGSGCTDHTRQDLETARHRAAAALRAAQDTLERLDELVQKGAPRLRCTVTMQGDDGGDHKEVIEVALASSRLTESERLALCAYLEGLMLEPDWEHLSASSAGCEAIATKCAKLPDRPEGVTLKPGAILLLGTCDRGVGVCQDDDDSDGGANSDEDDRNKSWLGDAPPALRVYYANAVMPHQGRGAKVLGYVKTNLSFFAMAKPRESSESGEEESNAGFEVVLSNVSFM